MTKRESKSKDILKQWILNEIHKFPVIGTLQKSPEFAKAYKCPLGSKKAESVMGSAQKMSFIFTPIQIIFLSFYVKMCLLCLNI